MSNPHKPHLNDNGNSENDDEWPDVGPIAGAIDLNWDDEYGSRDDWPPEFCFSDCQDEDNPYSPKRTRKQKKVARQDWVHDPSFDLVYSYNELAALKDVELPSVLDGGIFPAGEISMVYGQTEISKTTLILNAIVHIASFQSHWLGKRILRPGPIVSYFAEDRGASIHTKISEIAAAAGIEPADIDEGLVPMIPLSGSKRDRKPRDPTLFRWVNGSPRWTPMFEEFALLIAKTQPVAFVIDPRSWVFAGNLNDPAQQHEFTSRLKMLAIEHNCAGIVLAHPSRAGESGGYSGHAVGWDADARGEWLLRAPKNEAERAAARDGGEVRVLELRGNHMKHPETLVLLKNGFHFSLAGDGAKPADAPEESRMNRPEQDRADLILGVLRKHGPMVSRSVLRQKIAHVLPDNTGSAGELVRKVLVHLRKLGLIEYNRETVTLNLKATQTQTGD